MSLYSDLNRVIGDAIDLAAETLCPRDHTAEHRAQAQARAQDLGPYEYPEHFCEIEPPLAGDELVAVRQLIEDRFGDQVDDVDYGICMAHSPGVLGYLCSLTTGHPGYHMAFGSNDPAPFAVWEQSSRAVGLQRAQYPGEEDGAPSDPPPSPGDLPDSELLYVAARWIDNAVVDTPNREDANTRPLIAALRDRAAQFAAFESP